MNSPNSPGPQISAGRSAETEPHASALDAFFQNHTSEEEIEYLPVTSDDPPSPAPEQTLSLKLASSREGAGEDEPQFQIHSPMRLKVETGLDSSCAWIAHLPLEAQRHVAVMRGEYERKLEELESALHHCVSDLERAQKDSAEAAKQHKLDRDALAAAGEHIRKAHRDAQKTREENGSLSASANIIHPKFEACVRQEDETSHASSSPRVEELQRQVAILERTSQQLVQKLKEERRARQDSDCALARIKSESGAPQAAPATWFDRIRRKRL